MNQKSGKILIVDDDIFVLESLELLFEEQYDTVCFDSGEKAISYLESNNDIDTAILDIKMAGLNGLEVAKKINEINPDLPIVFYTGYPGEYGENEIDNNHEPFEYVEKSSEPVRIIRSVKNAVNMYQLIKEKKNLSLLASERYGIIGKSILMLDIFQTIEKIAKTDSKVMILGETGTGKELVARAVHNRSKRSESIMAILNCNHKQPDLIESELFGHLKGSFTGAIADRVGMFEYANNGTLFLDEIGDLDITTQAKLLRVLETGEIQKIGSPQINSVNVRVICATHKNLEHMVKDSQFREDLYYRLKGIQITLPPLRERKEDIPLLTDYFIENHCLKNGYGLKVFNQNAINVLIEYDWPGNVRQLQDTVKSVIDMSHSAYITEKDVSVALNIEQESNTAKDDISIHFKLKQYEKTLIIQALSKTNNNISAAARVLKCDPSNLRKKIIDFNIELG